MKNVFVLNGPNLNLLGTREPAVYGAATLADVEKLCTDACNRHGFALRFHQSNHEGALVDAIQAAYGRADGIVINPGAYTHTSVALLDAVKAVGIPCVEVHISNPDAREEFRRVSYIRAACVASIQGHGFEGYLEAMRLLSQREEAKPN